MYNYYPEELSADFIYKNVNQKEIIDFMYGYSISLNTYIINIFRTRPDNNPGAWFEYYNGRLVIIDFADSNTNHADVIKLVRIRYNLNYRDALLFIYDKFILGKNSIIIPVENTIKVETKERTAISYAIGDYKQKDIDWWGLRDININDLLADKVYNCNYFEFYSRRTKKTIQVNNTYNKLNLCYIYTHYISRCVKIYQPINPKMKFITNCTQEDIGLLQNINYNIPYIIITKSYKDCKILQKLKYNAIYILNEVALPSIEALWFLYLFDYVYIIMDSDFTGIRFKEILKNHIIGFNFNTNVKVIKYDFWNDTDSFYINDKTGLIDFLKENIKYNEL